MKRFALVMLVLALAGVPLAAQEGADGGQNGPEAGPESRRRRCSSPSPRTWDWRFRTSR
jgi:hypothetical protein